MNTVRSSLAITFASRYTTLFLTIAGTLIIARLLTPHEVGIYSVSAVVIGLSHTLRSAGVGQYLIQEPDLTEDRLRSAFLITLTMAWLLGAVSLSLAPLIGRVYEEPGITEVIQILSISLFLIPFGSITLNLLMRNMQFGKMYWISTTSAVAYFLTSVGMAWFGFGYISLAWAGVVGSVVTILMCGLFRPPEVPLLPGFRSVPQVLRFGAHLTGANLSKEGYASLPDLVIGKVLSMDAVAYFGKALGAVNLFGRLITSAILPVVLPHFSRLRRDGEDAKQTYLKAVSYLTVLALPFYAFLACMVEPIILILFGSQWEASVPIARILAFYGMLQSGYSLAESLFVSHGQVATLFKVRLAILLIHGAILLITASHGLEVVAFGFIVSGLFSLVIMLVSLRRTLGVGIRKTVLAICKGLVVAASSGFVPLLIVTGYVDIDGLLVPLLVAGVGALFGWFGGLMLTRHALLEELRRLFDKLKFVRS